MSIGIFEGFFLVFFVGLVILAIVVSIILIVKFLNISDRILKLEEQKIKNYKRRF